MKVWFKSIKSKQLLIAGLTVLVAVAGYYRWTVEQNNETVAVINDSIETNSAKTPKSSQKDDDNESYGDYFARARYDRDCARSEAAELLSASAQDGVESEEIIAKKTEMLEMYAKNMEDETTIENMVIA